MHTDAPKESFRLLRPIMVLSSMAPLFLLWAVRGSGPLPDKYFILACLLFAILPTIIFCLRIRTAKRINDCQIKTIYRADDHRGDILVYLFATLLPFYTVNLKDTREFAATLLALIFILFLFWHLNMHYMNLLFALQGYRIFTVTPDPKDRLSSKSVFVILTKRIALAEGERIEAYRLSDTVFIEK